MSVIDWGKLRNDYEKNGLTIAQLAEKHNVKEGTIKSQKSRDSKAGHPWKKATKEKVATKNERLQPSEKDASSNSPKKRSGNPNPMNQFSHRNNPKWTHGLRSKFLHQEQIEIIEAFEDSSIADKIWIQLEIKFSAIIRMQKIMWVADENDISRELSMRSSSDDGDMVGYKVAFAYEKYEAYVKALARATSEYRNLANDFLKHAGLDDERRLKLEQMELNIDKTKAEIEKISNGDSEGPLEIRIIPKSRE